LPYWVAQVAGAIVAAAALWFIASGAPGFDASAGLAQNGYGEGSPGDYGLAPALLIEVILTAGFLIVILGSTDTRAPAGFAPIAIGLALTLIHLISIPVTNTSVNPARSTGPALLVGGIALQQLWLFWVAPSSAAPSAARPTASCSPKRPRFRTSAASNAAAPERSCSRLPGRTSNPASALISRGLAPSWACSGRSSRRCARRFQ
jgi:hypothetical protein